MLEGVIASEDQKVEQQAERGKQEVRQIAGLVEDNFELYGQVFDPDSERSTEELPQFLYDSVRKAIRNIREYCGSIGVIVYHGEGEDLKMPEFWLGQIELNDIYLRPTEVGYRVLDGLTKIRGQLPVREANKRANEALFATIKRERA